MQEIIEAVDRSLIEKELTPGRFVKPTNSGNNEIYIVTYQNSPNTVREIGRLREITFRDAGGGTGLDCDLDEFDIEEENPFQQLFVWDPREKEIIGGYRFIHGKTLKRHKDGHINTPTSELFHLSEKFIEKYLPHTIELGRSFVQPNYQPTVNLRKGMYALDNIWNGLGAILVQNPDVKYYFGKITMYPHYNVEARDLILYFLRKYFSDKNNLVYPHESLALETPIDFLSEQFTGGYYEKDYKILVQLVRQRHENIPPLVNAYMNLSSTMLFFGTSLNPGFGDVEESGILVTLDDVYDFKKERHLSMPPII
ncbi:MAG: GNAT family N-acetyltransferase [Bacteroidales bacterium]|nr:GNAT family N-acetyltransferase [Bacteroidales bacterium]